MAGWQRAARIAAAAALGLALSACNGAAGDSSAAQSSAPAQSTLTPDGTAATGGAAPTDASVSTSGSGSTDGSAATDGSTATDGAQPTGGNAPTDGSAPAQGDAPAQGTSGGSSTGSGSTADDPPPASAASVTVNWTPPTENTDGTALTDLSGYKIHYGTESKKYTTTVTVSNPGLATYVIASLPPGTYYFAVTAYNAAGTESPLSSEATATVD